MNDAAFIKLSQKIDKIIKNLDGELKLKLILAAFTKTLVINIHPEDHQRALQQFNMHALNIINDVLPSKDS